MRAICLGFIALCAIAAGCAERRPNAKAPGTEPGDAPRCVDRDGDGYGTGCEDGYDCDDGDPERFTGCLDCAQHDPGCACDPGTPLETCFLEPSEADVEGMVMCHEGTRYCRDGVWSTCEDIFSYQKPKLASNAVIDPDAGAVSCNECNPICFRVIDNLDPIDGGLGNGNSDTRVDWAAGGGLTLGYDPDASVVVGPSDAAVFDPSECMVGTAPDRDCDGIHDDYDPYPDAPPFATANPAIFLDIPAGYTGVGAIDLSFSLNSADIYFLVDQSASMTDERDRLKADLTTGDFINDPDYDCADYDYDHLPNNELKDDGIVGAIRCIIRDSNFGAGFFREIPFPGYANDQQIAFDNYQDITSNVAGVQAAIDRLDTIGNYEWPEASMLALNNLITGDGMYFGIDKRGVPPRVDCPVGTWGYPCFRDDAIPIVIMFTDAMMHNGPSSNNYAYDPNNLTMNSGTDVEYVPVASNNETFASAHNAKDVTNRLLTFTGELDGMSADVPASDLSCLDVDGGADAVFAFSLSQQRDVTLSSEGTRFDTVLGLFSGVPSTPTILPDSGNTNETAAAGVVDDLGEVVGGALQISGNTSAMAADYAAGAVGCGADPSSADAVYRFTVGQDDTNVAITTEGSTIDTVIALYDAPPPTAPTYTTNSSNTNDTLTSPAALGEIYNDLAAVAGDTSAAGINATFSGSDFGCGADSAAGDAVYRFDLSMPTRVEISTEGSSYDTVIALVGNTCVSGGSSSIPPVPEITGGGNSSAASSTTHTFGTGSYIIPMDTDYQDFGMLKAYGLVYDLLLNDVPVSWIIRKNKGENEADFTASASNARPPPAPASIGSHGYRGGPFVVDSTDASAAAAIIDSWLSAESDLAVHVADAPFSGYVRKQLIAAPSIAMFADKNQDIARAYMQAAGIPDSSGSLDWADDGPDMLFPDQVAGADYANTHDGALFDDEGVPTYCQMMSMHWSVDQANTAEGEAVVAEYRDFLQYPVHLFAECQAVNAIENNANGKFLTENGYLPIDDPIYQDVITSWSRRHHDLPFTQMDGDFASVDGSEPHYTLPDADGYKDDDVVMVTDAETAIGHHDVWMTGYLDGGCSILNESCDPGGVQGIAQGKISYLGGHNYKPVLPISDSPSTNGTRLFLNALFEADCATDFGDAVVSAQMTGPTDTVASQVTYTISYDNDGPGIAYFATLEYELPAGVSFVSATGGAGFDGSKVAWDLGSLNIDETGSVQVTVDFAGAGTYSSFAVLDFKQGLTQRRSVSSVLTTNYDVMAGDNCTTLGLTEANVPTSAENANTPYDIGLLNGRIANLTGSTASMSSDYDAAGMGCNAQDGVPDAAFHFRLTSTADVEISTEGTGWDSVVALYDAASGGVTSVPSDHEETTDQAQDLGTVNGTTFEVTGGTTVGMTADYDGSEISCAPGSTNAPDAAYRFHVDTDTRVKIDTSGSSFDTVVSLHDGNILGPAGMYTETVASTAENRPFAHVASQPTTGNILVFDGDTSGMNADQGNYSGLLSRCHEYWDSSGADAVIQFEVTADGDYDFALTSAFTHALAIYDAPYGNDNPVAVDYGKTGNDIDAAIQLGVFDGWAMAATGETFSDNWSATDCNATANARDTFFEFTLESSRTLRFDSSDSAINSVLHVYRWDDDAHTSSTLQGCDDNIGLEWCGITCGWVDNDDARLDLTLGAGDYFVVLTAEGNAEKGDYNLSIADLSPDETDYLQCAENATDSNFTRTLTAGTYYAVVKGNAGGDEGTFELTINDASASLAGENNLVDCNDDAGAGDTSSEIELDLTGGQDYWVVVKGAADGDEGNYNLRISDVNVPPVGSRIDCDDDSGTGTTSSIATTLGPGDYWAILGGKTPGDNGDYEIEVRDVNASVGTVMECNDDGGANSTSIIERDLPAGSYYVVVKGDAAGDEGAYRLAVRDVTNNGYERLACDQDSGPGQASLLQRTLDTGTYYLVVKGDAGSDEGAYTLSVQDSDTSPIGAMACNDDAGSYQTSIINRTLNPGTYYVALKGYDNNQTGRYQLSLGGADVSATKYVPPTWSTTAANLQATGARVIPVLSCQDDPYHGDASGDCTATRAQAQALANATDTLGENLQPLVYDIDRNGSGLSSNVVEGITSLSKYLEMDVQVVIDFDPDANPGFNVSLEAVDEPGDGCNGLANGLEHLNCIPGATPKFLISFENPLDAPVPLNPTDPLGGYNFKALLIGDGHFLVDQVPIYIIPEDVDPSNNPPSPPLYDSGEYWQDTSSPGCVDNQRPDWRDLSWNAEVPSNTTITFSACAAETAELLDMCTPSPIAAVTGVGTCTSDSDCSVGYCDIAVGACQVATGSACTSDAQCPSNASCIADLCTFNSQPVYIGSSLGIENFQPFIRMSIGLSVTEPFPAPPVLHGWEMTYLCSTVD